jgi:serine/threonine protein phosphatase PrpC
MDVHAVSLKGRRDENEDKHSVILNSDKHDKSLLPISFFGVYDGHGGKFVSDYLSKNLPPYFVDISNINNFPFNKKYVYNVFSEIQNNLKKLHKQESKQCGSTCLNLIYYTVDQHNYINIFNVGDSRCIICRDNIAIPLTKDHKPMWPDERRRIEKLNGSIYFDGHDYRIKDLSVSRAFGDTDAEPYLTSMPDIFKYRLEKNDKFIILGCDGLYDYLENQDIVNFILNEFYDNDFVNRINKSCNAAKKLGEYAIQKGSTDNITVIIIFID